MAENEGLRGHVRGCAKAAVEAIWEYAERVVTDTDLFQHCVRVDGNLRRLSHDKVGGAYKPEELMLLSGSAALHDLLKDDPHLCNGADHGAAAASFLPRISGLVNVGNAHAILSMMGAIIRIHDQGSIRSVPQSVQLAGTSILLPRLALLFKIADMLDCSAERLNRMRLLSGLEEPGPKTDARLGICDWELVDHQTFRIILSPRDVPQMKNAIVAVHLMDAELRQHEDALHLLNIPVAMTPALLGSVTDPVLRRGFTSLLNNISADDLPEDYKFPIRRDEGILVAFVKAPHAPKDILLHWKPTWKQWLLPSVPMALNLTFAQDYVTNLITNKYHLKDGQFSFGQMGDVFFDHKVSPAHKCMTEYRFRIAIVRLKAGSPLTKPKFTLANEKYRWWKLADCQNNLGMQAVNARVWRELIGLLNQ